MTLDDLIAEYRSAADDNVKKYLSSDEDVARWLAEAEDEACIRARLIFDATTPEVCSIAVQEGVSVYPTHPSIHEITYASLVDGHEVVEIGRTDRLELSRIRPGWRTEVRRPDAMIVYDTSIELNARPRAAYPMQLEVYRTPLVPMALANRTTATPSIAKIHHIYLVQWALHRAYSRPDAEVFNPDMAKIAEDKFIAVFGERPDADLRKKQQANRPQHNKAW